MILDSSDLYEYKGKQYFIVEILQLKHPETREWVRAVAYKSVDENSPKYVRVKDEFFKLFKNIKT